MWQYEKSLGSRYAVDYVRGNSVFAVHFLSSERIEGFIFDMQPNTQFNPASYAISMSEFNGLSRRVFENVEISGSKLSYDNWKKIGNGSLEDFDAFAKYAVDRLPMLTKEIFFDGVDVIDDVPEQGVVARSNFFQDMRTINWTHFDREMFRDFYRSFCRAVKKRRGLFARGKFSRAQADGLLQIVRPIVERCGIM